MSIRNIYRSTTQTKVDPISDDDKIAITGIGCRYGDGVAGPREIWDMLKEKRDCTGPPPPNRFDKSIFFFPGEKKKGKVYTKAGGYLKQNPEMFDRQFFKMSPDEAEHMDPQIRILLEVVWESIEDAGIPASALRGSNTGVYMGVTANEYLLLTGFPQSNIGQYTNSGTNTCMISNRISYEFDLRGPSFSIDTACSSSLYAVQIACDALRGGICDTAIAGGVNIILTPSVTIGFCQAGMLSPDGQCKSFDESANGYSRSEGVGSVVLKPLKRAIEDGDRIYAVIRGGALTNDGRTPGIANPSFDAQIDLVEKACAAAKVDPRDITYIEAHGTGTPVGDKTEANAIGEAMSKRRSDDAAPLFIGSIKSNVGHAEGAAGIAGVIKTALSLYHREIPGVVHFKRGNPNINFKDLRLRVPSSSMPWPAGSKLLAGCSSFGFGGANAHVVLEAPPLKQFNNLINITNPGDADYHMLLLSATSKEALQQKCSDWIEFLVEMLEMKPDSFLNALYTASVRSHHHIHRLALLAKSRSELVKLLRRKVEGNVDSSKTLEGKAPEGNSINRTVFVFSGMGTQWWGMARQLMSTHPIFSNVIQEIDGILGKYGAKWSLMQILSTENDRERINDTEMSQTCICSVQIGLVELYKHYGVTPSAIIGHSVGEVAAAYAAGLLTMTDAVRIIFTRGHLLTRTSGSGTMAAVLHDANDVQRRLKSTLTDLDVAAVNSPSQIVLSGKAESIKEFTSKLSEDGIQTRVLKVNNAFHSRQQEVLMKDFYKKSSFLGKTKSSREQRPLIPMMSTVTNRYLTLNEANGSDYWWTNIRQQVRFKEAVEAILKDGYNSFLEVGAHPALSPAIKDIIASKPNKPNVHFITHSLVRPRDTSTAADDALNINVSLAQMYVNGYPVDMRPSFCGQKCKVESLPLYPWQRVLCSAATSKADINMRYPNFCHPLLGKQETSANYAANKRLKVWKSSVGTNEEPWIADHVVQGSIVLPAAGFMEVAIATHYKLFKSSEVEICDLHFDRFLFMSATPTELETTTEFETEEIANFALRSLNVNDNKWMTHTTMNLIAGENKSEIGEIKLPVEEILKRCPGELSKSGFYANKKQVGFDLGESFMCIEKANFSRVVDEALIQLRAPDTVAAQSSRFYVHPALLDGILQGMAGIERQRMKVLNPAAKPVGRVPRSVKNIQFRKIAFPDNVLLHYTITSNGDDVAADVYIADTETHDVIGKFKQIRFGPVATSNGYEELKLWEKKWIQIYPEDKSYNEEGPTVITGDDEELSRQLSGSLRHMGITTTDTSYDRHALSNIIMVFKAGNKDGLNKISKEYLLSQQSQIAALCVDQYNSFSRDEGRRPNMWVVTRDGFPARNNDLVDPSQASAYGFGLCVMQEDPSMKIFLIDLPSDVDNRTASNWLIDYIWRTDHCDNILALRQPTEKTDRPYNAYSLRLTLSKADEFPYKLMSSEWKFNIEQSVQSGRLFLTKNQIEDDFKHTANVAVKVGAFHLIKTTGKSSNEAQHFALFCGQSSQNKSFIGFCTEKEFKSTMHCRNEDIVEVTSSLRPEEVVNIILSYLVPFGVVRNFIRCKESTTVVCMSSNTDKMGLATAHMAAELGHNVVLAVKDLSAKNGVHLHADHQAKILDVSDVPAALKGQSVNFVIGCESTIRDLLKMRNMKEKFSPFAIIGVLDAGTHTDSHSKLRGLPNNVIVENIDHEFYSNEELQQMKPILDELLQVFDKPSSVNPLKDALPKVTFLKDIGTNESISFNEVTIAVDNAPVSTSYDFLKGEIAFEKEKSYLVTGGTKGFGLCVVEWLSANGAGCVYILSRSEADFEAIERLNELRKSGTSIVHIKTDITSKSEVDLAFKRVSSDASYPLSGIFHCAAQYDDKLLKDITPEIWKKVMSAKSWGGLLLHQASIKFKAELKYFVMISSVVQLMGNGGQASYCAANTYLSNLGYFRRSKGLPATVFCPGVIRSDGFAARSGLVEFWERRGIESLAPTELLNGLGVILRSGVPEMGMSGNVRVRDFVRESKSLFKEHITVSPGGRFSILKGFDIPRQELNLYIGDSQQNDITHLKPEEAKLFIFNTLCGFISQRLGITSQISPDASPSSLGVDSLMTTELSGVIQGTFSVFVQSMELMNANITLQAISSSIYKKILAEQQLGGQDKDEEDEEDTSWKAWFIMDESVVSPEIQLICFPPNGGGPSTYAWWQNQFGKHNVQLIMAQLPGWEGRHQEKPLQTIEEITNNLTEHLVARLIPGRFVLFGHSLGGLIAFEVAHRLIERNLRPAHIIISSWYAPTLAYPNEVELEKAPSVLRQMEQDIKNNIKLSDNKALRLSFLDDEALNNPELMKRLIPCFRVGFKICQKYTNTHTTKLQCGMTVLGAKSDRFVPPALLDAWCLEIQSNRRFKKTVLSGGHMHITSAKKKFFQEIQTTLRDAFAV